MTQDVGTMRAVIDTALIDQLTEPQVRASAARLMGEVRHKQATIDKLTHEMAVLKRLKFAARSERYGEAFNAEQKSLLEEAIDADLEALRMVAEQARAAALLPSTAPKEQPKRQPLPVNLPRREIRHEPDSTTCRCGCALKCIGESPAKMTWPDAYGRVSIKIGRFLEFCRFCRPASRGVGSGATG